MNKKDRIETQDEILDAFNQPMITRNTREDMFCMALDLLPAQSLDVLYKRYVKAVNSNG